MVRVMDNIVLNVEDVDGMMAFYTGVIGLSPERFEEFRSGQAPFPSVRIHEDTIIDLFPKSLWERTSTGPTGRPNLNHFCLAVDRAEWDNLQLRLAAHRVAIEDGPFQRWGAHGTGISIYFRDPEANLIEARYYTGEDTKKPCLLVT